MLQNDRERNFHTGHPSFDLCIAGRKRSFIISASFTPVRWQCFAVCGQIIYNDCEAGLSRTQAVTSR